MDRAAPYGEGGGFETRYLGKIKIKMNKNQIKYRFLVALCAIGIIMMFFTSCSSVSKTRKKAETEAKNREKTNSSENSSEGSSVHANSTEKELSGNQIKKEDSKQENTTSTEVTLKPSIDPKTGEKKPSSYQEFENGKPTKELVLNGDGSVTYKSNSSSSFEKKAEETKSVVKKSKDSISIEEKSASKNSNSEFQGDYSQSSSSFESEKKKTGFQFMVYVWIFLIIIAIVIIWYMNRRFNITGKIRSLFKNK